MRSTIAGSKSASASEAMSMLKSCWALAKEKLGAAVIQQAILPIFPALLGNNEHQTLLILPSQIVADVNVCSYGGRRLKRSAFIIDRRVGH